MKATIRYVFGMLTFTIVFLSIASCSDNKAPSVAKQHNQTSIAQEKHTDPPMIVRQFGCCKAHQ